MFCFNIQVWPYVDSWLSAAFLRHVILHSIFCRTIWCGVCSRRVYQLVKNKVAHMDLLTFESINWSGELEMGHRRCSHNRKVPRISSRLRLMEVFRKTPFNFHRKRVNLRLMNVTSTHSGIDICTEKKTNPSMKDIIHFACTKQIN